MAMGCGPRGLCALRDLVFDLPGADPAVIIVKRILIALLSRLSPADRADVWIQSHGLPPCDAFPGSYYVGDTASMEFLLEARTSYPKDACLNAIHKLHIQPPRPSIR